VVSHCRLFFRQRFFHERYSALHQRRVGASVPNPFASPPGRGLSPPVVNVLWGSLNLVIAYLLVFRVGTFDFRRIHDVVIAGVGGLLMAVMLSRTFAGIGREGGK
jgi:hypothetical protein